MRGVQSCDRQPQILCARRGKATVEIGWQIALAVRAVVFDLDGTLVDFNLDYRKVRAEVLELLSRQGLPRSVFSLRESIFKTLKKAEIYMKNHGLSLIHI